MKKSELRELVREIVGGYEPDGQGNLVRHNDKFDSTKVSSILKGIINRSEKPVNEDDEDKFYSKEEVIDYIKNHPPVKYYRIGVSKGTSQTLQDAEKAIEVVKQSPINQFELSAQENVIAFNAPFDQKHADLVRSMGSLD